MKSVFKKGSKVEVISGADKGKVSTITKLFLKKSIAVVQGVNIKTHFDKKDGLLKIESPIALCKLKLKN
ncbi:MAG: 50S ribosomal protein L24 [Bdellovibrionaceae bacterium]|nr:50S ribosomal protein L24 [Pseudobdellovibrionaceae bacterium]